ncbi:MAG TPA: hypothetical protein ENJ90_03730 [Devosia sp.]|nr:hypothetical protein [Devosia sp.]
MNKPSPLTELANFVGKSESSTREQQRFWHAYSAAAEQALRQPATTRVTDLLGMVATLSARTRRIAAPVTIIELDVFTPEGKRAVQLMMSEDPIIV